MFYMTDYSTTISNNALCIVFKMLSFTMTVAVFLVFWSMRGPRMFYHGGEVGLVPTRIPKKTYIQYFQ